MKSLRARKAMGNIAIRAQTQVITTATYKKKPPQKGEALDV